VLAVGIFYYHFVHKGIHQQIRDLSTESLEQEIQTEQVVAAKIAEMQQTIEENEDKKAGSVAVYNNLAAEISYVGFITEGKAENVSLSWGNPVLRGTTVRREVRVSFTTDSYEHMKELLTGFYECPFRCIVHNLSLSDNTPATATVTMANPDGTTTTTTVAQKTGIADSKNMSVSFSATFFETIEGATTTEGLVIENVDTDPSDGALVSRSKAYADNK
jgi:hypothetical protein